MKKLLLATACMAALAYQAHAIPLSVGDAYYLGLVNPGAPADATDEVAYINNLTTLDAGAAAIEIPEGSERFYNRIGSTLAGPFPAAVTTDGLQGLSPADEFDATGFDYVLGKYGQESMIWYVGGTIESVTLPASTQGGSLSHVSFYNPDARVPDGGATASLLGLALTGFGFLLRRKD